MASTEPFDVWTVGHSTRPIDTVLELLTSHRIAHLVDVRTLPMSRRHPQFNGDRLAESLAVAGIGYTSITALGGLRAPSPQSINGAWRNSSFRGYADHMQSSEFEEALGRLLELAAGACTAAMCAEALPWKCHRSLIADALVARGLRVRHILAADQVQAHALAPFARVEGAHVTYPAAELFDAASHRVSGVEQPSDRALDHG